jgi:hypothetical protein
MPPRFPSTCLAKTADPAATANSTRGGSHVGGRKTREAVCRGDKNNTSVGVAIISATTIRGVPGSTITWRHFVFRGRAYG